MATIDQYLAALNARRDTDEFLACLKTDRARRKAHTVMLERGAICERRGQTDLSHRYFARALQLEQILGAATPKVPGEPLPGFPHQ